MRALWLLALYIPLVFVPWILTCVLARRPLNASSYVREQGFTRGEVAGFRHWKVVVDVFNSIAGLITIPFLSALLSQAAVVFCQRQRPGQSLGLQDLFALADRGWTNIATLWTFAWSRRKLRNRAMGAKFAGSFLLPAAALVLLGALQQPLYQILVTVDTVVVTTCSDTRFARRLQDRNPCSDESSSTFKPIGVDIEPARMALLYHNDVLPRLAADLASISLNEEQPNLWVDEILPHSDEYYQHTLDDSYKTLGPWLSAFKDKGEESTSFVAGLPANTATGTLREHLMRFNSSVSCKEIDRSAFPSMCPGKNPFVVSLQRSNETTVRICVPGEAGAFPWTTSRDRQDIIEEIYLDLLDGDFSDSSQDQNINATILCQAKTTRGGFVPTEQDTWQGNYPPSGDSTLVPSQEWRTSGPLMLSAMAMFGNTSWLDNAVTFAANMTFVSTKDTNNLLWQRMCAGMPFAGLFGDQLTPFPNPAKRCRGAELSISAGFAPTTRALLYTIHHWLDAFNPSKSESSVRNAETLLQISLFTAHRALLTSYGLPTNVIGLQLVGLGYLSYYIYQVPTWTGALDAMAMARIGASLGQKDVSLSTRLVSRRDLDAIHDVDVLIGVVDKDDSQSYSGSRGASDAGSSDVELKRAGGKGAYMEVEAHHHFTELAIGAPGVVTSTPLWKARHRTVAGGGEA
ncbi:hypothetical protein BKA63DRAFT_576065 [Paraphoma chrysanthemicola]|nr:hypothetical protein BKA63DRAFT_576065 [Paraphoma chrysanthemicola]